MTNEIKSVFLKSIDATIEERSNGELYIVCNWIATGNETVGLDGCLLKELDINEMFKGVSEDDIKLVWNTFKYDITPQKIDIDTLPEELLNNNNHNTMKQANFLQKLNQFTNAAIALNEEWSKHDDIEGCEKYPFGTSFDDLLHNIIAWEKEQKKVLTILPFSGSYTVYKNGDKTIPSGVQGQLSNGEPFEEVLVCNLTEAYIVKYIHDVPTVKYWTVVCNQDVLGTLDECVSFLQKELN